MGDFVEITMSSQALSGNHYHSNYKILDTDYTTRQKAQEPQMPQVRDLTTAQQCFEHYAHTSIIVII